MEYLSQVKLATQQLEDKMISRQEWAKLVLGEEYANVFSDDYIGRAARCFSIFIKNADNEEITAIDDEDKVAAIRAAQEDLIKERKRLQTVNIQAQEYYRAAGRAELLIEQIQEAISSLEPVEIKHIEYTAPVDRTGLLVIADAHYDSNFSLNGLFGETVNVYNKDTFKSRMWALLGKMDADDFGFDKLKVVFCGDSLEGMLRLSSLTQLRQPVVKSLVEYAEFISQWLVEVSNRLNVPVEVAMVPGNHTICRYLSQKPELPEENLEYIIHAFVSLRLKECENITVAPYDDVYFTTIYNENFLFAHGENKDLEALMSYFENLYNVSIDACFGAHYHSASSKDVGVGNIGARRIIRVPSMVGTDTYAKKLLKNNRAGAYFACFDENGECFNKVYYLN